MTTQEISMNIQATATEIASVDQQLEQHAASIERIQRDAVYEIGRELAAAQELFRYRKDEGGFTGWLANRLPHIAQRSAYQAISIFKGIDPELLAQCANIPPRVMAEVAKAEPDVQALIAERVEAGEIFTAAKVKEIRQEAAREARAESERAVEGLRREIDAKRDELERMQSSTADVASKDREIKSLNHQIADLSRIISQHEKAIEDVKKTIPKPKEAAQQAKQSGGVVLGSDGRYHSGASPQQKALTSDFLTGFAALKDFSRETFPSGGRVAAGCPAVQRLSLREYCMTASTFLTQLKETLDDIEASESADHRQG